MIYDCFTFMNELDLLELRLRYLDPVVDKFVIVEADKTFSGKPKPFVYPTNRARFEPWAHKIRFVPEILQPNSNRWELEYQQRNAIAKGLSGVSQDDYVMIGDVDEIPDRDVVKQQIIGAYDMYMFNFFVNVRQRRSPWDGTVGIRFNQLSSHFGGSPQVVRNNRSIIAPVTQAMTGWHFSYLGDEAAIRNKLASFAHAECDNEDYFKKLLSEREFKHEHEIWQSDDVRYGSLRDLFQGMSPKYFTGP
jgi:hypothetical protein